MVLVDKPGVGDVSILTPAFEALESMGVVADGALRETAPCANSRVVHDQRQEQDRGQEQPPGRGRAARHGSAGQDQKKDRQTQTRRLDAPALRIPSNFGLFA